MIAYKRILVDINETLSSNSYVAFVVDKKFKPPHTTVAEDSDDTVIVL